MFMGPLQWGRSSSVAIVREHLAHISTHTVHGFIWTCLGTALHRDATPNGSMFKFNKRNTGSMYQHGLWWKWWTTMRIKIANSGLLEMLKERGQLKAWEEQKSCYAMFKSLMNYLCNVETNLFFFVEVILFFVEASRNVDIILHVGAGEALNKLFVAFDRLQNIQQHGKNLEDGNLSVTKSEIPFVSLGSDHACEQLNRMMKVHTSLVL